MPLQRIWYGIEVCNRCVKFFFFYFFVYFSICFPFCKYVIVYFRTNSLHSLICDTTVSLDNFYFTLILFVLFVCFSLHSVAFLLPLNSVYLQATLQHDLNSLLEFICCIHLNPFGDIHCFVLVSYRMCPMCLAIEIQCFGAFIFHYHLLYIHICEQRTQIRTPYTYMEHHTRGRDRGRAWGNRKRCKQDSCCYK